MNALVSFFLRPSEPVLAKTNILFFSVCLCFGALLGSAVSAFVISGAVYSAWHVARSAAPWPRRKAVIWCSLAFCAFFGAEALAGLANPSGKWAQEIIENVPFLGFWALYGIVHADRQSLLWPLEICAVAASVLGAVLTGPVTEVWQRPELMAGNAGVLAVLAAVLFSINLLGAVRNHGWLRWLSVLGMACSAYLVMASGMRALWPMIIVAPALAIVFFGKGGTWRPTWSPGMAAGIAAVLLVGGFGFTQVSNRLIRLQTDISAISRDDYSSSVGMRMLMWKAGYELFLEKPVLGQGPGNAATLMAARTKQISGTEITFTHFHNAALTELVRAGVVGFLAMASVLIVPFVFCLRAKKDDAGMAGFFILCAAQCAYLFSGLTGIMFGHDILDSVYITVAVFGVYMVFGRETDANGQHEGRTSVSV
jgi:O-antigen ligase